MGWYLYEQPGPRASLRGARKSKFSSHVPWTSTSSPRPTRACSMALPVLTARPFGRPRYRREMLREGPARRSRTDFHTGAEAILDRALLALVNEGFRVLEEGLALRPSDLDVV